MVYFSRTNPSWKPRFWPFILWTLATIAIGVYILVDTHDFARILAVAFAVFLIVSGVINLILFFRITNKDASSRFLFWQGLLRVLAGTLALVLPVFFANLTWISIIYLVGFQFLVSAIMDLSLAWRVYRTGFPLGVSPAQFTGNGLISLVSAMVLFLAPRLIGIGLLRLIALGLILLGSGFFIFFTRLWWFTRTKKNPASN
jgi:uncharacterized membrane protein HdeD (DUF308 family)